MAFVALIDANALVPGRLRGVLVGAALEGLYQPAWTDEILHEVVHGVANPHPGIPVENIRRNVELLRRAVPSAMVTGYEALVAGMTNDKGDRHVLAAAVHRHADAVVTFNRKHFPESARARYDIDLLTPDEFLLDLWDLDASTVARVLIEQAGALEHPPMTVSELVASMVTVVPEFADAVLGRAMWETREEYVLDPAPAGAGPWP
jgi:predicted nucleic acid-binding protein